MCLSGCVSERAVLPDGLDQSPLREILFTIILTLIIKVEVWDNMLVIILLAKLQATTFQCNLLMTTGTKF